MPVKFMLSSCRLYYLLVVHFIEYVAFVVEFWMPEDTFSRFNVILSQFQVSVNDEYDE